MLPDFSAFGSYDHDKRTKLERYYNLLAKWQKSINLVSAKTLHIAGERHFKDSVQILPYIPNEAKNVLDLGSGAGFPGLVVAIMRPDINVSLIESDARKCEFLKTVSRETVQNVTIHNQRIEAFQPTILPDVITARAFAPLSKICSLAINFLKEETRLILHKGQSAETEIADAKKDFSFKLEKKVSQTDPDALILILRELKKKQ